jgi:hypothetical protein
LLNLIGNDGSRQIRGCWRELGKLATIVQLFVVCSSYLVEMELEPSKGRIMLFRLADDPGGPKEFKFIGETVVAGAAYAARPLPNAPGKVAVTVNSRLVIFTVNANVTPGGGPWRAFELECKKTCPMIALYLAVHGDTIVVGDLMQSVSVFRYNVEQQVLEHVAGECECALPPLVGGTSNTLPHGLALFSECGAQEIEASADLLSRPLLPWLPSSTTRAVQGRVEACWRGPLSLSCAHACHAAARVLLTPVLLLFGFGLPCTRAAISEYQPALRWLSFLPN